MNLNNRKLFFRCFRPVMVPLFATGCQSFRLNDEQQLEMSTFTRLYTYLARIVIVGTIITGMVLKMQSGNYSQHFQDLPFLIKFLALGEQIMTMVLYIEVSLLFDAKKYLHMEFLEEACQLDEVLVRKFAVNFHYEKTFRKNIAYMIFLILYCCIYDVLYYLVNIDSDWRMGIIAVGYVACTLGPNTSAFAHICAMDFLRIRFRLFQKMFKKFYTLSPKEEEAKRNDIIFLLQHYQKYCELVNNINNVYGEVAIYTCFHDFTQITSMVFVLCHKALESRSSISEYALLFFFVAPVLVKVIYTGVYSKWTINESKICSQIIATYNDHYPDKEVRETIDAFLMWKVHNQLQFTVGKALKSNFGLIYSFFLGIGNYVLILIQLKFQEASIVDRFNKRQSSKIN